jgi:hypothetical protein
MINLFWLAVSLGATPFFWLLLSLKFGKKKNINNHPQAVKKLK